MSKTGSRKPKARFLEWQCQLRQAAMRDHGGKPSTGMRPHVVSDAEEAHAPTLTVLLEPEVPDESTAFFRFQTQRSADPRETYQKALRFLQSEYYQDAKQFSGRLLAVLPPDAQLTADLIEVGRCVLDFSQGRHSFRMQCKVKALEPNDTNYAAAIWHNRVFNPSLPEGMHVLSFKPDWKSVETNF